jgi:transcription initiation factor TFIID subunit 10
MKIQLLLVNLISFSNLIFFLDSVRLISLAAQKFLSDIANDALQHCKVRTSNQSSKSKSKDRNYTLTLDDLTPALMEHGINVRKPSYYV